MIVRVYTDVEVDAPDFDIITDEGRRIWYANQAGKKVAAEGAEWDFEIFESSGAESADTEVSDESSSEQEADSEVEAAE